MQLCGDNGNLTGKMLEGGAYAVRSRRQIGQVACEKIF